MAQNHKPTPDPSTQLKELYEKDNNATKEKMKVLMGTLQNMSTMLVALVQATDASSAEASMLRPVTHSY